jgi:hypothetical protein
MTLSSGSTLRPVIAGLVIASAIATAALYVTRQAGAANTHSIDLEDSSSQYLDTADTSALSTTGDMTIEAWVKPESQPTGSGQMFVASKWNAASNQRSWGAAYVDVSGTKKLRFYVTSTGSSPTSADITQTLPNDTWAHLAWVYTASSGQVEMFVNGSSIGTGSSLPSSIFDSSSVLLVGAVDASSVASFFDGLIDDVRVWNVARTSTEIANDYQQELNGNESGLVAYWKLNNSLTDTIGSHTLTNNGSSSFSASTPFVDTAEALAVRKSANESVTSSTALQNDDQLKLTLLANKTYIVEGIIVVSSTNVNPDIKIAFTSPTGSAMTIGYTNDQNEAVLTSGAASSVIQVPNGTTSIFIRGTVKTLSTGGDLQLRWAQNASNANATTVLQGSFLKGESID